MEFLELGGIHLAAQDVGGLEEEAFELGERDLFPGHNYLGDAVSVDAAPAGDRRFRWSGGTLGDPIRRLFCRPQDSHRILRLEACAVKVNAS